MPDKNQEDCYRTINGVRWPCFCDVITTADERAVKLAKENNLRRRVLKHPDEFLSLFLHPDDVDMLNQLLNETDND